MRIQPFDRKRASRSREIGFVLLLTGDRGLPGELKKSPCPP
jgi:hypothetical protein